MSRFLLRILAAALFLSAGLQQAQARRPRGTEIAGIIEAVDPAGATALLRRESIGDVLRFTWDRHTTFLASGKLVGASILRPRARVKITIHRPLFGQPYASRVGLLPDPSRLR